MSEIVILHAGDPVHMDPTQSGFAHGFGLFETLKLAADRLCFWQAHWQRLRHSADVLKIPFNSSEQAVLSAIRDLVQRAALHDGIIKLSLLREATGSRCYVYARPAMATVGPAQVQLSQTTPLNQHSPLAGHKTHNYMENMVLLEAARAAGFFDLIRVNTSGVLTETAVANLFLIQHGQLCTPAQSTGILPGVIRAYILQMARTHGIPVLEGDFPVERLQDADAVFLSNSVLGILPVQTIAGTDFNRTLPHGPQPIIDTLRTALADAEMHHSILLYT